MQNTIFSSSAFRPQTQADFRHCLRNIFCLPAFRLCLSLAAAFFSTAASAQQDGSVELKKVEHKKAAYMGAGSCSNSTCHGATSPRNSTSVLQNEYVTWQKHDRHAQSWLVLTNADSKKIGQNMGIAAPEKDPLCLTCHATYVAEQSRQSSNFTIQDGVSCESCHGAAENWLGSHTANDATHKGNLDNGMLDVVAPAKRASLCLSCHYGTEDKFVNHRLMGSGHPRMTFELDTFSLRQPAHWNVDDDYQKRKGERYNSARAWLVGQVTRSQEMLAAMLSDKRSRDGAWPELTLMYCYSCHHSLGDAQWKTHDYGGSPGELRLNVSSLIISEQALKVLSPELGAEIKQGIESLHAGFKSGKLDEARKLVGVLQKALTEADSMSYSSDSLNKVLKQLMNYGATNGSLQYEVAEQLAMGAASVLAVISPDGKQYRSELTAVFAALKDQKAFKAEDFAAACAKFGSKKVAKT